MDNLKGHATKALFWDLFGSYGGQISSFVISIFLARLLSPEDFGLVGMSMVFIGMLQIFKEMGFSSALIQNETNTSLTYSSVFYINVLVGLVLTILIFFSAPFVSLFFDNESITLLVRLLSITFFLNSLNLVQSSILSIKLDFKKLTYFNLVSQISAGSIAIGFAFNDFGVLTLVIQQIAAAIIFTLMLWRFSKWKPKLEFSWLEIRKLSSFSIYVFAASSVNKIIEQLDTLIIGKLFTPLTLGFFARANSLNNLIIQNSSSSITRVFFPTLVKVKNEQERFERIYLKVVNIVSSISIFLTAFFFLIGEELIIGLFGNKWQLSIPIFQILILKGFTTPVSSMIVNAFLAKGKSKENFFFGNIRKVLQLVPFVFAYLEGFNAFLYANVGVAILAWMLNNLFANISLKIPFKKQMLAIFPNLIIAILMVLGIRYSMPDEYSYFWAFVKGGSFTILFLIFLKMNKSPLMVELKNFYNKLNIQYYFAK